MGPIWNKMRLMSSMELLNMDFLAEDATKLLFAIVLGGLIGVEREIRDKPAGFRTMILIAVGSTLFTIFSIRIAGQFRDPARIAAQIVTGVGFLGAGAILRGAGRITGLTTAASIWLVASVGIGIGMGEFTTATVATGMILVVLLLFGRFDVFLENRYARRAYDFELNTLDALGDVVAALRGAGLHVGRLRSSKEDDVVRLTLQATGARSTHERLGRDLMKRSDVVRMRVT
jgi:putative Mg2+ transporter-C (MgtC) family protein